MPSEGGAVLEAPLASRPAGAFCDDVSLARAQEPHAPDWSRARVVRHLSGAAALAYIAGKAAGSAEFREVQEIAAAKLRKRGLRPTTIALVLRIEVPRTPNDPNVFDVSARFQRFFVPTLAAEVVDGYDVIAQSWDDGDNSTWEGNHYVQELSSGHWTSTNDQHQLPAQPYQVNWTESAGTSLQPRSDCRRLGSPCGYCADESAHRAI